MHYAGCINSIISSSTSPPYRLYSNAKPSAMCSIKWFTEKAIKLQRCSRKYLRWRGCAFVGASRQRLRQELDIWICPLCLWFFTVWAKTGNLANLFGCCATDSTLIARLLGRDPFNQNFRKCRSKTQWIGSVQPEKFRKNRSTFWGGPLFPVGLVWILVEWIAPLISLRCWSLDLIFVGS